MPAKILVIGLDGAEATLVERWAAEGHMPRIKTLMETASGFALGNEMHRLPGAIWSDIATGISVGRFGIHQHSGQLHTGETHRRYCKPEEIDPEPNYWVRAARAGLRTATLDVPLQVIARGLPGLQLMEWGTHERHLGSGSEPPSFIDEITREFGPYPVFDCETHGRKADNYAALIAGLKKAVPLKTAVILKALQNENWDLFTAAFSEAHCAGHQLWHFHDARHPWHSADDPSELLNAFKDIYGLIDSAVGQLIDAAGERATVVFLVSHGMEAFAGGNYLLDEVMARLGYSSPAESGLSRLARKLQTSQNATVSALRAVVRAALGPARLHKAQADLGASREPLTDPRVRAVALYNNRCGAIRLNLKGREPFGAVAPGNEAKSLIAEIRERLAELRDPATNEYLIVSMATAEEAYGADHHPDIPDLLIEFRTDLGEINGCVSPRLGHIGAPNYRSFMPRSGDHTGQSRLWLRRPGVAPRAFEVRGHVIDVAPTILDLAGLPRPQDMDGHSLLS
jgi:predicted AlkP superfamily phosphohydrolase/phosphomutase